ncbi:class D beta-lactamase [bacterium D16-51]|nr:class D beta-lactamase [bacterium D16-59]RKI59867.1 class D beta-lactamase [bacterium D16-51]
MKKTTISFKVYCCVLTLSVFALIGCSKENDILAENQPSESQVPKNTSQTEEPAKEKTETVSDKFQEETVEPVITEIDWSKYFKKINGAAVIYDPTEHCYQIYNQKLASTRRSPCSTFKIVSSLIALEHGILEPDNSTRTWSGEVFWNENWNKDIDFYNAFHDSCVWYFREVVDEIGKDITQRELNRLQYGNCDISDWRGKLNNNNNNPALTGFWIESSLLVSPKEQTEVIERIFGDNTTYSKKTRNQLKQVMLLSEPNDSTVSIYGKTGMGKSHGIVVDAWYTGFAETDEKRIYFCVYLGQTDNKNVSSTKAKEIAVKIISAYL